MINPAAAIAWKLSSSRLPPLKNFSSSALDCSHWQLMFSFFFFFCSLLFSTISTRWSEKAKLIFSKLRGFAKVQCPAPANHAKLKSSLFCSPNFRFHPIEFLVTHQPHRVWVVLEGEEGKKKGKFSSNAREIVSFSENLLIKCKSSPLQAWRADCWGTVGTNPGAKWAKYALMLLLRSVESANDSECWGRKSWLNWNDLELTFW